MVPVTIEQVLKGVFELIVQQYEASPTASVTVGPAGGRVGDRLGTARLVKHKLLKRVHILNDFWLVIL